MKEHAPERKEDARTDVVESLASRVRKELLPKVEKGAFSEDEISRVVFTVVNHGATLPFATQLFETQQAFCDRCGECCRVPDRIVLRLKELLAISRYLKLKPKKLMVRCNVAPDDDIGDGERGFRIAGGPCPFLRGTNVCSIYPVRPKVCQGFPALPIVEQLRGGTKAVEVPPYCHVIPRWLADTAAGMLTRESTATTG